MIGVPRNPTAMPKRSPKRLILASGLLTIFAASLALAYQGGASRVGQPSAAATVNLSIVMEKLEQKSSAQANLTSMAAKLNEEDKVKKAELTKMQTDLKAMTEETAAREELQEQLALATLKYQAWNKLSSERLDIEESLVIQDLYKSIKDAVAQMAKAYRLDIVLVDDSKGDLQTDRDARVSQKTQVLQQIADRRMLYANPEIDITDDLIERMNNAFKTGGAVPAKQP
jgi:Skp family chaperone for outer membrane proteins